MENVAANALFLNEPCDDDVEMIKKTRWIHEWKKAAKLPNCKKRKWKPKNKTKYKSKKKCLFYSHRKISKIVKIFSEKLLLKKNYSSQK